MRSQYVSFGCYVKGIPKFRLQSYEIAGYFVDHLLMIGRFAVPANKTKYGKRMDAEAALGLGETMLHPRQKHILAEAVVYSAIGYRRI